MKHLLLFLVVASSGPCLVWAEGERMGTFRFSEFSLSPRLSVQEPSTGGVELKESWIGFEWERDQSLSGDISFGSSDLVTPAIWYATRPQQLELVEAAVKARTPLLDFRAGLIRIPNGYEGAFPEWEWQLPATRVRNHRWFAKRDYGLELKAETKPYLTSVTLHNGESGNNIDDKMWTTFLWRFLSSDGSGALVTAEVGRTDPKSTSTAATAVSNEGFHFDVNDTAKFRVGSFALFKKWQRNLFLLEAGRGEILQKDDKQPYAWGHVDMCANLSGDFNLLLRYEQSQADLKTTETMVKSFGLGFSLSSKDRLSAVTLWANKNSEPNEIQNDEVLLVFRLNSNSLQ